MIRAIGLWTTSVRNFLALEQVFSATWHSRHGGTLRVVGLWLGTLLTTPEGDRTNGVTMILSGCPYFLMFKAISWYLLLVCSCGL